MRFLPLSLLALLAVALLNWLPHPAAIPPAYASPPDYWDPRLDALGVTYHPATDCIYGCWRLVTAVYEDEEESNGLHHIWARALDANGTQVAGEVWTVAWPDGSVPLMTKPAPDWSDFAIFGPGGCYFPDQGETGPFRAFVGSVEARSDTVRGIGLPYCLHVSFRLTWQWVPAGSPPAATSTSNIPGTPVPPPSPCPECEYSYLPLAARSEGPVVTQTPIVPITPVPVPSPTSAVEPLHWDPELNMLGVTHQPASTCSAGCWRLVYAEYEDDNESGGNHNIYSRLKDEQGNLLVDAPWHAAWPDGNIRLLTKPPWEWADFSIFACYFPDEGPGPYWAYAGDDASRSDRVYGMGLPACHHVNFRLVWQWQPG
jgi:hypothetical protein